MDLKIEGESFVYPERETRSGQRETSEGQAGSVQPVGVTALSMMLPSYPRWKRGLDIVGAIMGLVISAPILFFWLC